MAHGSKISIVFVYLILLFFGDGALRWLGASLRTERFLWFCDSIVLSKDLALAGAFEPLWLELLSIVGRWF